jgi:hypothetical protein
MYEGGGSACGRKTEVVFTSVVGTAEFSSNEHMEPASQMEVDLHLDALPGIADPLTLPRYLASTQDR